MPWYCCLSTNVTLPRSSTAGDTQLTHTQHVVVPLQRHARNKTKPYQPSPSSGAVVTPLLRPAAVVTAAAPKQTTRATLNPPANPPAPASWPNRQYHQKTRASHPSGAQQHDQLKRPPKYCQWAQLSCQASRTQVNNNSDWSLQPEEEGCYTGRSRSYAATEPSHGRIQPVREGEPSGQTPPLKACIARSACSQSLMETVVH
jgi:hypothetical protein